MTDVTGFGLAGHLWEICRASNTTAHLDLDAIPIFPGTAALLDQGIRSTIHAGNRAALAHLSLPTRDSVEILFDPQTAGGFLAAIPQTSVETTRDALLSAGYTAAVIGHVTDGPPSIQIA